MPDHPSPVPMAAPVAARRRVSASLRRELEGWLFVAPWIVGFLIFLAGPFAFSAFASVHRVAPDFQTFTPVGLENFNRALFSDATIVEAFVLTLGNTLVDLPLILVFSLLTSILLNQRLPGRLVFRSIFFLPVVIGTALVIRELAQREVGILALTRDLDLQGLLLSYLPPPLAVQVTQVFNRLVLVLWQSGVQILLFLAGLQSIPPTLYEAGRVDGVNSWEAFWMITLPQLSPIVLVVIFYTLVASFTDPFNQVMAYIQLIGLQKFDTGYAAAIAWLYFAFVFLLLIALMRWVGRLVFYAGERH